MADYDEDDSERVPSVRFQASDLFVIFSQLAGGIAESFMDAFNSLEFFAARHANWKRDQMQFAEEASAAIERIDDLLNEEKK